MGALQRVVDTTLRDGEQMPGLTFFAQERLALLDLLKQAGVGAIEIPGPAIDPRSAAPEWSRQQDMAVIVWNRAVPADIELSLRSGFRHIHVSLPVSAAHIEKKLGVTFSWILFQLEKCIKKIRAAGALAYVGAEDASRASDEFFLQYARLAADMGAQRVRFADTVGCLQPTETEARLRQLQVECPIPLEFHGHNDFGLALANHLAAENAGIHWHSGTVRGIGERAGNADLRGLQYWLGNNGRRRL
jgi:homocitrate synthase NifV